MDVVNGREFVKADFGDGELAVYVLVALVSGLDGILILARFPLLQLAISLI